MKNEAGMKQNETRRKQNDTGMKWNEAVFETKNENFDGMKQK